VPIHAVGCERGVHYYAMQFIEGQTLAAIIAELRLLEGLDEERCIQTREGLPSLASGELAPAGSPGCGTGFQPVSESATRKMPVPHSAGRAASESLSSSSTRSRAFFRTAARLGIQAAEAIEHAHGLGVVHRDLKPANILIDDRGNLWITDFGLARLQNDSGLTLTGDLMGTLRYMSPEQAMGRGVVVDHRTDIYSMGVTLYELLTLRPACPGDDRQTVLRQVAEDEPIAPRRHNPAIPRELETIVLKAIAKEPGSRYATAQELADDLRRFLENRPIRARRPTPLERATKWARRHTAAVVATTGMLILTTLGLTASLIVIARERDVAREQRRIALEKSREADSQRRRAEDRARQAREAVDTMYTQVAEQWLGKQPRLTEVQRAFLLKALHYYQEAMKERSTDLEVRKGAFNAATRAGLLQYKLGEHREAEQAFRHALTLARELAEDFPAEARYRFSLATLQNTLANLLDDVGRSSEAEEEYRPALAILKQLVGEFPGERHYRRMLAAVYNNMAEVAGKTGRRHQAEEAFRQAVAVFDRVVADFPGEHELQMMCAVGHFNLANTLSESSPREAEQHCRKSLSLLQPLVAQHPEERDYRWHLGTAYYTLSNILAPTNQRPEVANGPEAMQCRRQSLAIFQKLAGDFPRILEYRRRLAIAQAGLGALLRSEHQFTSAAQSLSEAIDSYRQLVREAPGVPDYRSELALAQRLLGNLLSRTGQARQAEETFRQARSLYEKLVADFPAEAKYRADLALLMLTCPVASLRDTGKALEQARQAVRLAPQAGDHYDLLGMAHYRAGEWGASREALLKGEQLPPGRNGGWFFLAMAEWRLGHREEARRWYDKAVQWTDQNGPQNDELLQAFRTEAAALLGVTDQPKPTGKTEENPAKRSKP
jgi:tetratricopeptide (TPR) repeat protein